MFRVLAALAPLMVLALSPALAAPPVRYHLSFPAPQTHYVEVEATVPTGGREAVELMMPVWTPGSYLVREYARHVEDVVAQGKGGPLPVTKVAKNRWRVGTGGADPVRVRYRVYGREMSVRTNWIEQDYALIVGAATFLTPPEATAGAYEVEIALPRGWTTSVTGLAPAGAPHRYRAPDFDHLVDSPLLLGRPEVRTWRFRDREHVLADQGGMGLWDGERAVADLKKLVEVHAEFWGGELPYDRYVFINVLSGARGGLEHHNSTVLMHSRWAQGQREDYLNWLRLASHEFFHTWNVKRLRPVELGPFDYEREVHTRSLWIAEGVTAWYDALMVRRAGLSTDGELLDHLSKNIAELKRTPGARVRSVELASHDAWIRFYRPDENSRNTNVSYYLKGALLAFLLDARIRTATGGARSLDDVMRLAWQRFSGERGYDTEAFYAVASEVAGADLGPWFARFAAGTDPLDFEEALRCYGLRFAEPEQPAAPPAWLGVDTQVRDGRLVVTSVSRDGPAWQAGVNVDDELIAVDDERLPPAAFADRLKRYRPGKQVSLLLARRDRLQRVPVTFAGEPRTWKLEVDPNATPAQKASWQALLTGRK